MKLIDRIRRLFDTRPKVEARPDAGPIFKPIIMKVINVPKIADKIGNG